MQIGVDSFGAVISDPATGLSVSALQRMDNLLDEIVLADQVRLDVFGIGEHHRSEFVDSAPPVILGAAATRTRNIRLTSAVTVLSAADPVRIFQEFATLDRSLMAVLKLLLDEVRQSRLFRSSVSIWMIMTHFSQRSWNFFLRSARTLMFTGRGGTALLSRDRRFIRVRSRILFLFGSASVALQNHSFVLARSAFP